ncbi:MAG: hypothetical protein ACLP50_02710 [Solirubrobacteraceae bacterium]
MSADNDKRLERRVARAAEEALADHGFVSPIDVLCGLGWLHPSNVARWRRGRPACLEDVVFIEPARIATAIGVLQRWARERGLEPSERPYPAGSRALRELRFSAAGDLGLERAYRTHWLSLQVSEAQRAGLTEREVRRPDLVVIEALGEFTCSVCGAQRAGLLMMEDRGPVCMASADLDQLVFLSSGDAALTRRARSASGLSAIVVRFSRARKRYDRRGVRASSATPPAHTSATTSPARSTRGVSPRPPQKPPPGPPNTATSRRYRQRPTPRKPKRGRLRCRQLDRELRNVEPSKAIVSGGADGRLLVGESASDRDRVGCLRKCRNWGAAIETPCWDEMASQFSESASGPHPQGHG